MGIYGNAIGSFGSPKTFLLVDESGEEYIGVVVGEEVVFTATAEDIKKDKVAGTSDGVTIGTHVCE